MNVVNTNSLVLQQIQDMLKKEIGDSASEQALLTSTLRYLFKWRSVLIQNTFIKHQGTEDMQGPFAGMDFLPHSAEGWHSPNSVDKYYCQNLNGRNANAKSKIHS
jgi:hypothetical protein